MINPIQKEQQKELEKLELCVDILTNTRNELYLSMRFFDVILSKLEWLAEGKIDGIGTDGFTFYYRPGYLIDCYKKSAVLVNRSYLHSVFHCLFGHLKVPKGYEEAHWNLACDIVVESIIDSLNKPAVRMYTSPYRRNVYQRLQEKLKVFTSKAVYRELMQWGLEIGEFTNMKMEFWRDDHCLWEKEIPPEKQSEREKTWKELNEKLETEMETFSKEATENEETLFHQVQLENKERYDYRKFLKKFSVLKEEMQIDADSFDYIFYHYGIELYGNMPLLEPQETKEVMKIEDFVIAIDTSMSCREELVKKFLEETYSILSESESFFRKINIHIIQCDDKVQSDVVVRNQEELHKYMEDFEIKGLGGTDFRPVFGYVNQLLKEKVFHKLKGLLYFTDGYGTFPMKRPLYETAFVFMKEDYTDINVPVWAMKLIVEPEEIENTWGDADEY